MALVYQYIGIENLGLNDAQRDTLVAAIRTFGRNEGGEPRYRMQPHPVRMDRQAGIFEATFDDSMLTIAAWKTRLAAIFGVNVSTITHTVNTPNFGQHVAVVVTFSRLGTDYLRVCLFGGVNATWEQSRLDVLDYLAESGAAWGAEDLPVIP